MKKYIKLLRVNHYIKNLLIFLPLFFSENLMNIDKLIMVVSAFLSFSFMASTIYIINDIKDIEKDKKHLTKKNRPIASGEISIPKAKIIAVVLFIISLAILSFVCINFNGNLNLSIFYILLYFILNLAYTFKLKEQPIIDIIILATGFVLRVMLGGAIIDIEISSWLYLTIFAISFYLGLGKRRNEYVKYQKDTTRSVLKYYNKEFLDKNMYLCMALAIAFYALWAKDYNSITMIWTVPIVMIMAMKYSYNIENENSDGDPTDVILKDKFLILLTFIYIVIAGSAIYF